MSHLAPLAYQDHAALLALRAALRRGGCPVGAGGSACRSSVAGFLEAWDDRYHPCTWPGVLCDCLEVYPVTDCSEFPEEGVNHVYALDLGAAKPRHLELGGSLPGGLGSFTQVRMLDFRRNAFAGPIPAELGQLPRLERLLLSGNAITGGIPPELGRIPSLRELHIDDNLISGTVPPELCAPLTSERTPGMPSGFNIFDPSGNPDLCGEVPECLVGAGHLQARDLVGTGLGTPCEDALPEAARSEGDKDHTTSLLVVLAGVMGLAVAALYVRHAQSRWQRTRDREDDDRMMTIKKTLRGLAVPDRGRSGERRMVAEISEITFVFTDIESSTRMALMDPFAYEMAQLTHDEVMRDALEETGGYEINTQGDSFELAFGSATQAVRFCLMVQEKLLSYKWPYAVRKLPGCETVWGRLGEGMLFNGPRVRMGIHHAFAGTFEVKQHDFTKTIRFSGKAFEIARLVGDVAHGGQILMTEVVKKNLDNNYRHANFPSLTHLGTFSAKQLGSAVQHLTQYQVNPGLVTRRAERSFPQELGGLTLYEEARGRRTEIFPTPCPSSMGIALTRAAGGAGGASGGVGELTPAVADEIERVLSSAAQIFGGVLVLQNSNKGEYGYMFKDVQDSMNFCLVSQLVLTYRRWELIQEVDNVVQEGKTWGWLELLTGSSGQAQYEKSEVSRGGRLIFNGPRLAMAVHEGDKFAIQGMKERSVALMRSPTFLKKGFSAPTIGSERVVERSSVSGELVEHATEILDIAHGGQTVLSEEAWQKVQFRLPDRIQVLRLGVHHLDFNGRCKGFTEVSPNALAEREFPPLLSCSMASPGYREAPSLASPMAIVFCQAVVPDGAPTEALRRGVDLWSRLCHNFCEHYSGYVCKEPDPGKFTLSFSALENAILFAVKAQEALMTLDWDDKLLEDPNFHEVHDEEGNLTWRGIRVRMGLAYGMASFKKPLMTGAADYFGHLPNLAARVMSKASGGQVLVEPAEHDSINFDTVSGMGKHTTLQVAGRDVSFQPAGLFKMKGIQSQVALLSACVPKLASREFPKAKGYVGPVKSVSAYLRHKDERIRQERARNSAIGVVTAAMSGARESWSGALSAQGKSKRHDVLARHGSITDNIPRFILKISGGPSRKNSLTSQGCNGSFSSGRKNSGYSASHAGSELQMRRMSGLIPTFMAENEDHDPEEDSPRGLFGYNPRTGSFTLENVKHPLRELRPRSPSVLGLGNNTEAECPDTQTPSPGGGGLQQQGSDLV